MPTGDATWAAGYVTSLSSGLQSVTGLGGTPHAVFFWGTNFLTEDSAVTSTGTAIFRGMAIPDYSSPGTVLQDCQSITPAGDASAQQPYAAIVMDTSGGIGFLHAALLDSFDADGFTLDWQPGSTAGYKVVYAALMGAGLNVGGYKGVNTTVTLGFKAGAMLLHGGWQWASTGFADGTRTQHWFGGAAYPGSSSPAWMGAGLSAQTFPLSASAQYNIGIFNNAPTTQIASDQTFTGPFLLPQNVVAYPSGGGLTDFTFNTNLSDNAGAWCAWDDEDSETGRLTPATSNGGTVTVSGLPFRPGLVTGYSISDEPSGQGTGGRGAIGFSVCAPGFQWTALIDGVSSRGAFQSFQRGVADTVNGTDVHAGTVILTADGFVVTTEEDAVGPSTWVWHAFGHPRRLLKWIPHIYRRITDFGGGTGGVPPSPPPPSFLLLEDGDRLELEDGSGFLILE